MHLDPTDILDAALQDGFTLHKDDKFLVYGAGGSEKSSLISLFINEQLGVIRISTPLAEQPIHLVPIRDVSISRFNIDWERVGYDSLPKMMAQTSFQLWMRERKSGSRLFFSAPESRGFSFEFQRPSYQTWKNIFHI